MEDFQKTILSITNIAKLKEIKDRIKDQVTDPSLRWDERMELYRQVQFINECIFDFRKEEAQN